MRIVVTMPVYEDWDAAMAPRRHALRYPLRETRWSGGSHMPYCAAGLRQGALPTTSLRSAKCELSLRCRFTKTGMPQWRPAVTLYGTLCAKPAGPAGLICLIVRLG